MKTRWPRPKKGTRRPENAEWQLGLGTSHFYAGGSPDARRRSRRARALPGLPANRQKLVSEEPANFAWRLEQSDGHSNVAAIYQRQGNLAAAREQLEIVTRLQAELALQQPGDQALQNSRANAFNRLGIVEDLLGDLAAADASFERSLEGVRPDPHQGSEEHERQAKARSWPDFSRSSPAGARKGSRGGRYSGEGVRRGAGALVALDPTNALWQRDVAVAQSALARLDIDQGRGVAAIERLRASREIFSVLANKNPTRPTEVHDSSAASTRGLPKPCD